MKKVLRAVFSMLLVASVAFSASADATLTASKQGSPIVDAKRQALTRTVTARPADTKEVVQLGEVRSHKALNANTLRSAYTKALRGFKTPIAQEAANVPDIYGSILYSDMGNFTPGLYQVPTNESQAFELVVPNAIANYGGVLLDEVYYTNTLMQVAWFTVITFTGYDIETGEVVYESSANDMSALSLGLAEYNGSVYGIFYDAAGEALRLGSLEYAADGPVVTEIAPLEGDWFAFAVDGNGQGYGIKRTMEPQGDRLVCVASTLYKINITTGAVEEVGATGLCPQYTSDMAFDKKSNRLFWTVSPTDETGILAEVNTTTGEATVIYHFPYNDEVAGLYIPSPPDDTAPGAPTDLKFDFEGGSLTGTVSFKAPTTFYNGEAGTGSVDYEVFFDETSVKTGTTTFGADVSFEHTVPASGSYKVTVATSNENGPGLKTKGSVFIGMGIPVTPVATLVYENGEMKLSWEAVTETVDGGFIDEETVTYTVTRYPGNVEVGTFENVVKSIAEEVEEPEVLTTYYYEVVANSGDVKSAAGKSNVIIIGDYILPPFAETFDDASSMDLFSVIDANADGKAWTWNKGKVRIQWNSAKAMDDWLMTAPVKLEAGKLYELEFDAHSNGLYPERLEVKMGNAATAEAMTTVLIEPVAIDSDDKNPQHYPAYVVVETTGNYHFGFHGISDADTYWLYLDNISISAPKSADIPASVSGLAVTPGANGGLFANLSFVTPDKLLSGKAITTPLSKVEVVGGADNKVLYTATNVAAGAEIVYPVNVPVDGTYTFTVTAYNENGTGVPASASAYIGIDYPEAVANVKLTENAAKPGEVTITWDAVTKDVRGSSINATYSVYGPDGFGGFTTPVAKGLTEPKYVCTPVAEGEQDYIQYAIFANSKRGEGEGALASGFVGTPYDGYFESFPEGKAGHRPVITTEGSAQWDIFKDGGGISAADGDNGFVALQGQYLDDAGEIMFGKISLANLTTPVLSFYTFNVAEDNINIIDVYIDDLGDDADYQLVYENYVCETGAANAWNKVVIDLSEYKGKEIALKLGASVQAYGVIAFDAIRVGDKVMKDLSVKVDAPVAVAPGTEFKVNVTVKNEADAASEAYVAKLKVNNVVLATLEGAALEMGASKTFQVPYAFSAVDVDPVEFVAEVVYAGDEVADNNVTDGFTVSPRLNKLPVPVELEGEVTPEGVKLTWGEPVIEAGSTETVVEDFETGEAGDMEFEGWTFVDVDGVPVGGFQGLDVPGITVGQTTASFFMFDASIIEGSTAASFVAHSGTKYLAAMFRADDGAVDDWAISPELSGNAQTVSFFARSYSADYPEKIEVYYSTGSTDLEDFIKIEGAGGTVPAEWTLYSADLPEGAAYFAVRSYATASFMLMLDDVTMEVGSGNVVLKGYNVYRNGVKVNAEVEAECEYLDTEAVAENNEYAVTAVYNRGESVGSNKVVVAASGIDNVLAGVEIAAEAGQITVMGAEGLQVSVVAVDGKVVFAAAGEAKTVVTVTPGVYVVKAGAKVAKVLVK